jgi:hypothetical protein
MRSGSGQGCSATRAMLKRFAFYHSSVVDELRAILAARKR